MMNIYTQPVEFIQIECLNDDIEIAKTFCTDKGHTVTRVKPMKRWRSIINPNMSVVHSEKCGELKIDKRVDRYLPTDNSDLNELLQKAIEASKVDLEDLLHTAMCQAVGLMNLGDDAPAGTILRDALVRYADIKKAQEEYK